MVLQLTEQSQVRTLYTISSQYNSPRLGQMVSCPQLSHQIPSPLPSLRSQLKFSLPQAFTPTVPSIACLSGRHQDPSQQFTHAQRANPRGNLSKDLNLTSLHLFLGFCLFHLAWGPRLDFSVLLTLIPQPRPILPRS